ncbi:GNAT family N-acetyltransferase [Enemella sp. A6]|uniref:GNAT family N-acetyltransferase n=1 Tax=Enemella sp. A6 TaxID=3440152 RepID=UPI003EB73E82
MAYEYRLNTVTEPNAHDDPIFRSFSSAVRRGFHEERNTDKRLRGEAEIAVEEGWVLRGVHATGSPEGAISDDEPVATFCEWTGELSLGSGRTLPLLQISDVTVRPTHRRQGFLRRLMTESLTDAHRAGVPVAGLTVTEATIYGRFGFGPATFRNAIEVDAGPKFGLNEPPSGRVEFLTPEGLSTIADQVFGQFHLHQAGSVQRGPKRRAVLSGAIDSDTFEVSPKVRSAAHWDDNGTPDGYVTWRHGWDDVQQHIAVFELVAVNDRAHLALWHFLCTMDLVTQVRYKNAPVDDPLPWAMADRHGYTVTNSRDMLWLRVLDPVAAFGARPYFQDGECRFRVLDPMGFADGAWQLRVTDGVGELTHADSAEIELHIQALGSVLLGGVHLGALVAAGLVHGPDEQVDQLNAILQARRDPRCLTMF